MYKYKDIKENKNFVLKELREKGIIVINDFFSISDCENSILEINRGLLKYKDLCQSNKKEGLSGDQRLFKFENFSDGAKRFKDNEFVNSIAKNYLDYSCNNEFILAGKVTHIAGKTSNSGGDWHRDSDMKQFKSILYLNDVTSSNGPFSFILNSKNFDFPRRKFKSNIIYRIIYLLKLKKRPPRYKNEIIKKNINSNNNSNILTVTGKRGTLILCDTSFIHRGEPIQRGDRYSFTNYFFKDSKKVKKHINMKFKRFYI